MLKLWQGTNRTERRSQRIDSGTAFAASQIKKEIGMVMTALIAMAVILLAVSCAIFLASMLK